MSETMTRRWRLDVPSQWIEAGATVTVVTAVPQHAIDFDEWKYTDDWCDKDIVDAYIERVFDITSKKGHIEVAASKMERRSQLQAFKNLRSFDTCRVGEHVCFVVHNRYPVRREFSMALFGELVR